MYNIFSPLLSKESENTFSAKHVRLNFTSKIFTKNSKLPSTFSYLFQYFPFRSEIVVNYNSINTPDQNTRTLIRTLIRSFINININPFVSYLMKQYILAVGLSVNIYSLLDFFRGFSAKIL